MKTGVKLNLTKPVRSAKTGMLLPKEGTLVFVTENLGRTLLLVEFQDGQSEYLFENEVEFQSDTPLHRDYGWHVTKAKGGLSRRQYSDCCRRAGSRPTAVPGVRERGSNH